MPKRKSKGEALKYSQNLLERFQRMHFKKFGDQISLEKASVELNSLARLVEMLFSTRPYIENKGKDNK